MSELDEALAARDLVSQSYLYTVIATNNVATRYDNWVAVRTGGTGIRDLPSMSAEQVGALATAPMPEPVDPWDVW